MLRNRLDGLVSLHALWVAVFVTAGFYLYATVTHAIGWITLTAGFNQQLYILAVFLGMLFASRVYSGWIDRLIRLNWTDAVFLTAQQIARLALVVFGLAFVTKDVHVSRVFLGVYLVLVGLGLVVANKTLPRFIAKLVFKSQSIPTIVIGAPIAGTKFRTWLNEQSNLGVDVLGFVTRVGDAIPAGQQHLGVVDRLEAILGQHPASQIILPLFYLDSETTKRVMLIAREAGCRVRLVEDLQEGLGRPFSVEHSAGLAVLSADHEPLENPVNRGIKRVFDIALSLPVVFFVLPPLTLIVWLAQRRQSRGPVFYRQIRSGAGRRTFLIFKYRTMHVSSPQGPKETLQATRGDSRIYPFGRFLRKTSLDEFPQFLNVLFGDMSVAGPRPHLVQHDDEFAKLVTDYRMRHFVKPGITGLAQCNGYRGEITEVDLLLKRVEHDLVYVRRWSPVLDVLIILRTVRHVFSPPKTAY